MLIGDLEFKLKPGETKTLDLGDGEEHDITVKSHWTRGKNTFKLLPGTVLKISSIIPDLYFLIFGAIVLTLCCLTFFDLIQPIYLGLISLIYVIPLVYYSFVKYHKYFRITEKLHR